MHNIETRRSVTGILSYQNEILQSWYSKRQPTVKTIFYGSDLGAARISVEMIIEY